MRPRKTERYDAKVHHHHAGFLTGILGPTCTHGDAARTTRASTGTDSSCVVDTLCMRR